MRFDSTEQLNAAIASVVVVAALAFATPLFAASVAAGAALEAVNFRGLRRSAELLLRGRVSGSRIWSGIAALRFVLLGVALAIAIHVGVDPLGLALGLSLVMPAAIIAAWRSRPAVVADAPALAPDDPSWERWNPWLAREREDDDDDEDAA